MRRKVLDPLKQSILDGYMISRIRPFKRTVYWKVGGKSCPIIEMGMKIEFKRRIKE